MKKVGRLVVNTLKILICLLCWLTISPLFYYMAGKWGMKKRKLLLMMVSPLFLILYLCIFAWGYDTYVNYQRKYYFADEDRVERITGVRLPDMKVVEYNGGKRGFIGDFCDLLIVEFEEVPSEIVYQTLDSLIDTGKTGWSMNDKTYKFSSMWGNGMPAPKGEKDNEDRSFSISFDRGSKKATILSEMW